MEVAYKKDGNRNILIIKESEINENDYKIQMVINNKISGIVPMSIESVNNKTEIHYEITTRTSLSNLFSRKLMEGKEVYRLIQEIKILSDTLKEYLLDLGNILLDFEFIFLNRQTGKYEFCYIPYNERELHNNVRNLFEKMLQYIDYNDKEAVLMAYGVQQLTVNNDFTVKDIMNCALGTMQEYKKQDEEEKEVFTEAAGIDKERLLELNEEKVKKKGWLHNLLSTIKRKNIYLSEEEAELKADTLCEEKTNYIQEERLYQKISLQTERNTTCLGIENDEQTTLLNEKIRYYEMTLKSLNQTKQIFIMPNTFPFVIGKSVLKCDFAIDSSVVSRTHLRILSDVEGYFVEDMNSTNGTFINGKKLCPYVPEKLNIGDELMLADVEFIVE